MKNSRELVTLLETPDKAEVLVTVSEEICKGCELCISVCPMGNYTTSRALNRAGYHPVTFNFVGTKGECTACGVCYWVCPDCAIREVKVRRR